RDARFRGTAEHGAAADLLQARPRARAPVPRLQAAAVDRRAGVQRVELVPAGRRAGEHRVARVRRAVQLAVPPVPAPGPVRTLMRRRSSVGLFVAALVVRSIASVAASAPAAAEAMASLERALADDPENLR